MTLQVPLIYNPLTSRIDELPIGDQVSGNLIAGLMGRNRMINGNFDYWQRGTSFSIGAGGYTADRFWLESSALTAPAFSRAVVGAGNSGFRTNPVYAGLADYTAIVNSATHYYLIHQRLEDVRSFSGKSTMLSFTVFNGGAAGRQISVELQRYYGTGGSASENIFVQKVTLAAGFNYVEVPITLDSVLGKTIGPNSYVSAAIWLTGGTNFNSRNGNLGGQLGQLIFSAVQWEENVVATPFEWRPDALELALCQRYYEKSYELGVAPGTVGTEGAVVMFGGASNSSAHQVGTTVSFRVSKRAPPAVTSYSTITGTAARIRELVTATDVNAVLANIGSTGFFNSGTQPSAQTGWNMQFHWTADAEL